MKTKKLTDSEYKEGVKSGKLMHVFNTETKKVELIGRDGCYSTETKKKLINLEHPDVACHPNVNKFLKKQYNKIYSK